MYLVDTNVISELRRIKPHGAVVEWLRQTANDQLFVAAVTIGEIQSGILNPAQDVIARPANINDAAAINRTLLPSA